MSFEETARAYCKARVEWLAIKRAMAATPCEHERDPDCRRRAADPGEAVAASKRIGWEGAGSSGR